MAIQDKTTLKGYFKTGDQPTQAQFEDLIDSQLNLTDGGTITGELSVGNVTASGNISASGTVFGNTAQFGSSTVFINGPAGHITASGNISASGTGSFGELHVDRYIRHAGDNDTHIEFLDNKIQLHAGNLPFITLDKDASTPFPLTINNGGNRINFRINDKDSNLLFKTNSEELWAALYFAGNQKLKTETGGIEVIGNISASGNITASGDISASGTVFGNTINTPTNPVSRINALTASIGHFVPPNAAFQPNNNVGQGLDFTFSGSVLFTTFPDHLSPQVHQRVEIAAGFVSASNGMQSSYFHTPYGKVGINTGNFTPTTPSDPELKVVGTVGAGAPPAIEAVGDISASGKITGLTGSFGRLEGLSPITFGDDVVVNGNITASNHTISALGIIGNGFVAVPSESQMTLNHGAPNADYIYKSSPHGNIGINNEHAGTINGHMALYAPNSSIRMAFSPTDVSGPINGVSQSFATSASLSAIRFQNLPTTTEQAAQIGTGSLWLSGSDDAGTSKYLMVFTG